jgi:hypothetical protein
MPVSMTRATHPFHASCRVGVGCSQVADGNLEWRYLPPPTPKPGRYLASPYCVQVGTLACEAKKLPEAAVSWRLEAFPVAPSGGPRPGLRDLHANSPWALLSPSVRCDGRTTASTHENRASRGTAYETHKTAGGPSESKVLGQRGATQYGVTSRAPNEDPRPWSCHAPLAASAYQRPHRGYPHRSICSGRRGARQQLLCCECESGSSASAVRIVGALGTVMYLPPFAC